MSPTVYIDLSGITTNDINKYAQNFIIYNVYRYMGRLMLINEYDNAYININKGPNITTNDELYGLAIK